MKKYILPFFIFCVLLSLTFGPLVYAQTTTHPTVNSVTAPKNGGTGVVNPTAHAVMVGEGASAMSAIACTTTGQVLTSNGPNADPSCQAPISLLGSGALATTATTGFGYFSTVAGVPTGVPATQTGYVASVYDTVDNRFYIYNGGWSNQGTALSSFVGATGTNTFDNLNFSQVWSFSTLTTQTALSLVSIAATTGTVLSLVSTAGATGAALSVTGNAAISGTTTTGSLQVTGNAALAGTTTLNNVVVTGTCTNCGGSGSSLIGVTATGTTAYGVGALVAQTATGQNTGVGFKALTALTTGANNTAVGDNAGVAVTVGGNNTLIGRNAGNGITTGGTSIIIGSGIGTNLVAPTGVVNIGGGNFSNSDTNMVSIGPSSLCSSNEVCIGFNALHGTNSTTNGNVGVGSQAGGSNTSGANNVYIGNQAGQAGTAVTTGSNNVFVGHSAEGALATTSSAVAIGKFSRAGSQDVAAGASSLAATSTNTNANTAVGFKSGNLITTGTNNLVLGALAGTTTLTTGSNNILMGGLADTTTPGASHEMHVHDQSLAVGVANDAYNITGMGANTTQVVTFHGALFLPDIGTDATKTDAAVCEDTTTHQLYSGSGTLGVCLGTSSARYKTNIISVSEGLAQIMRLHPVNFNFKDASRGDVNKKQYGFIAEEAANVIPALVGLDKDGTPNTVDYIGLIPVMAHAIQEQQQEILTISPGISPYHRCVSWLPILCESR